MSKPSETVLTLYELRAAGDPAAIRPLLHAEVRWQEPEVGDHMGLLIGPDAVIDMIERALATTGGTFSLRVASVVETASHCAALIEWSATKPDRVIEGRELAVYGVRDGLIVSAAFFPEDIGDDEAFWA